MSTRAFGSDSTRSALLAARERLRDFLPAPLLRRLPPDGDRIVSVGDLRQSAALADAAGCRVILAARGRRHARHRPTAGFPRRWPALEDGPRAETPDRVVLALRGACVSGLLPAVVLRTGQLLAEASQVLDLPVDGHPTFQRLRLPPRTRLAGRTLLLAAGHSGNFYHWMLDTLPRLRLVQRSGVDLRQFDHVLLPGASGDFVAQTLARVPELTAKRHVLDDGAHFECDELTWASNLHAVTDSCRWAAAYLRRTLLDRATTPATRRKLFLSRSRATRRRLLNEEEIWSSVLAPAGFTRVFLDELPLDRQIEQVRNAAAIVAPHGAALTHLVFAQPGCSIVELLSEGYPTPYFWNLAHTMGHQYRYVVCRATRAGVVDNTLDFEADVSDVRNCLADAGLSSTAGERVGIATT